MLLKIWVGSYRELSHYKPPGRCSGWHHHYLILHGSSRRTTHKIQLMQNSEFSQVLKPRIWLLGSVKHIFLATQWLTFANFGFWFSLFFFCYFFSFIFISWRLITLQYCSGFCHTLTWISHGFICIPHPHSPSHLPLHPIPLGLPSAPALSTCLMHPTWAGDLFHYR